MTKSLRNAFVSPLALSFRNTSLTTATTWAAPLRLSQPARSTRSVRLQPQMQQTKGKEKKKAAPVFSKDIKGNIVWTLRSASIEDIEGVYPLVEHLLPRDLVESMIGDSHCCTVCETSVKSAKEGEGYRSAIMGVVLVDLNIGARDVEKGLDAGIVKYGELVTLIVDSDLPDEQALKKMLLGSLKLMKEDGVIEVTHCNENAKRQELIKECLFKEAGMSDLGFPKFVCKLESENPDPMKKIM